jgi:hypothetical protein
LIEAAVKIKIVDYAAFLQYLNFLVKFIKNASKEASICNPKG